MLIIYYYVAFLILVGIIVAMVVLWKLGQLSVIREDIQRRATVVRKNIVNRFSAAHIVSKTVFYKRIRNSFFSLIKLSSMQIYLIEFISIHLNLWMFILYLMNNWNFLIWKQIVTSCCKFLGKLQSMYSRQQYNHMYVYVYMYETKMTW